MTKELLHITIATIVLILVIGFHNIINFNASNFLLAILFGIIIISLNVIAKKAMAYKLDISLENKIWFWHRYGFGKTKHFKNPIPAGIIIPIFFTAITLGFAKVMTILSFETTALKSRAAKRVGRSSYTAITNKDTGKIASAGIISILLISFIAYWIPGAESLAKYAAFYAFWNIIPFSQLDGTKILFGDKVSWAVLAIIILIFNAYALLL